MDGPAGGRARRRLGRAPGREQQDQQDERPRVNARRSGASRARLRFLDEAVEQLGPQRPDVLGHDASRRASMKYVSGTPYTP